jgi:chemotaxis protein MotB
VGKKSAPVDEADDAGGEVMAIYGDLVTFLMALFILLFVLSYNKEQDETFFTKMQLEFGGQKVEQKEKVTSEALFISKLQGYIEQEKLDEFAQIMVDEQKIRLALYPPVLFDSGRAKLKSGGKKVLRGFGHIIREVKNPIVVEGHTDNVPIKTEKYRNNWELSFHRSFSVLRFFMSEFKFPAKQLSATGYGEYQPIAANSTRESRSRNRRIEINIIRIGKAQQ